MSDEEQRRWSTGSRCEDGLEGRHDLDKVTQKDLLTIADLQNWIGLGRSKSYQLVQTGEIPSYRIGKLIRLRRSDVEEWLNRNRYRL